MGIGDFTEIVVPMMFFATVVLIVYLSISARFRIKKLEHDERMLAIEKGVDIPISPIVERRQRSHNPYTWPFVLIGIGLALVLGNVFAWELDEIGWELIPLLIGVGMLVSHRYYKKPVDPIIDKDKTGESLRTESTDEPKV